jgi:hypothetical protein
MGAVRTFIKSKATTLRMIILCSVLIYAGTSALHFSWIWRDHLSHRVGALMFFGSIPWSLLWLLFADPPLVGVVPPYALTILAVLSVGIGLGINLAIAYSLAHLARNWYRAQRIRGVA